MKAVFVLLLYTVLVTGCASQGSVVPSASGQAEEESRYTQSLPATDMGAVRPGDQERTEAGENTNRAGSNPERPYSRELALEEELILPGSSPGPENVAEEEPGSVRPAIDLNNTFTLQLVAMETMQGAIDYARQYRIDPEEAGVARILSHGEIYFVLAYGVYASHDEADRASLELQQQGVPEPWVRRLGTLERLSMEADDFQPTP
jgi:septal ring-binding cell division protein DamX